MDEIICYCSNVTKQQIWDAMDNGARTLKAVKAATGACTLNRCEEMNPKGICCGADIVRVMQEYLLAHK